jgi:hypothetical protein
MHRFSFTLIAALLSQALNFIFVILLSNSLFENIASQILVANFLAGQLGFAMTSPLLPYGIQEKALNAFRLAYAILFGLVIVTFLCYVNGLGINAGGSVLALLFLSFVLGESLYVKARIESNLYYECISKITAALVKSASLAICYILSKDSLQISLVILILVQLFFILRWLYKTERGKVLSKGVKFGHTFSNLAYMLFSIAPVTLASYFSGVDAGHVAFILTIFYMVLLPTAIYSTSILMPRLVSDPTLNYMGIWNWKEMFPLIVFSVFSIIAVTTLTNVFLDYAQIEKTSLILLILICVTRISMTPFAIFLTIPKYISLKFRSVILGVIVIYSLGAGGYLLGFTGTVELLSLMLISEIILLVTYFIAVGINHEN